MPSRSGAGARAGVHARAGSGTRNEVIDAILSRGSSIGTSKMEATLTLVDNDLIYNDLLTQKNLARTNLANTVSRLALFIEGFGTDSTLENWNGVGAVPAIGSMQLSPLDLQVATNRAALGNPAIDWIVWRLPWQFTENPSTGVDSVAGDFYGTENRRLRADRVTDFILWLRRVSGYLMTTYGSRVFKIGSEMKGFQLNTFDGAGQTWDFREYQDFYANCVTAILQGATDAGVSHSLIKIGGPYPVASNQGASDADSVNFDTRATVIGPTQTIRYRDDAGVPLWNMNDPGWGYPNKAPLQAIVEFLKLCAAESTRIDFLSTDFGTYNNDNIVKNADDFLNAYRRYKDHLGWLKRALADIAGGAYAALPIDLAEWYTKAQGSIADGLLAAGGTATGTLAEALRAPYMAALKAVSLIAMLEDGVWTPSIWSPFGRGDQRTAPLLLDHGNDPQQWYGGMVVRPDFTFGGTALPFRDVVRDLHQNFEAGATLYAATVSDGAICQAIATATKFLVVNKTGVSRIFNVNGDVSTFTPYQVKLITA